MKLGKALATGIAYERPRTAEEVAWPGAVEAEPEAAADAVRDAVPDAVPEEAPAGR
jgi:hypothetical protein